MMKAFRWVTILAVTGLGGAACAHSRDMPAPAPASAFVTLGTNSGPVPNPSRAEPANLLQVGGKNILVDVGDGAAWQLSKIDVPLQSVDAVLISHLHFDHTGGLFALLSQRYQALSPREIAIYGPPGTKELVAGLVASITSSSELAMNLRQRSGGGPADGIKVVEVGGGANFAIGDAKISTAANSHYVLTVKPDDARRISLSFRFDVPGRSIVYTGDTGPSAAVEQLAKGADLLVSEIMDPELSLAARKAANPELPGMALAMIGSHFRKQHLSPKEVGLLASRAGVKALVLTHNAIPESGLAAAKAAIAESYKGPVTFAADLDKF